MRPGGFDEITKAAPAVVIAAAFAVAAPLTVTAQKEAPQCRPSGTLARVAELPEASGLAVSRRTPGRLWSHNDSGGAVLVALDTRGTVTGRVTVSGLNVDDWEALGAGPCPGGSCLYVADIGDNDARRKQISVYRVAEPAAETTVAVKETFHATYPDGAHDAETLLVTPDGVLYVVTKGETGELALYRFPRALQPGSTHKLERVGKPQGSGSKSPADRITDGVVSPDGTWVVLRTRNRLTFYRAAELLAGNWTVASQIELGAVGETQGEGVAMAADGTLYLIGEGGGKKQPGTFATLACSANAPTRP